MHSLSFKDALTQIQKEIKTLKQKKGDGNILIAVTGFVASGKSRFCSIFQTEAEVLFTNPPIYLPFDLWINEKKLKAITYAERFFLTDLIEAVRCISGGRRFLIPRYDIIKKIGRIESQLSTQELIWNKRLFLRYEDRIDAQPIRGATDLYIDPSNGYFYSLFPATNKGCFLFDGTLVIPKEVIDCYDLRIFVQAPWPMRIARMIRRFNRKEVFGTTKETMQNYVDFLVTEARQCADIEIEKQISDNIMIVENTPDNISGYLDLAYLYWYMEQKNAPNWINKEEIIIAMQEYLKNLKNTHDIEAISRYRSELAILIESKHLLKLPNIEQIFIELSSIVH